MTPQETHLDVLFSRIVTYGDKPFFKSVRRNSPGRLTWDTKTYNEFGRDVDTLATHLKAVFQKDGISDHAVIGIHLTCGLTYSDIVHIYAVSRAGYVPNLLSSFLTDPEAIRDLLTKTQSKALIHDPTLNLGARSIREYHRIDLSTLPRVPPGDILPRAQGYDPDAVAFIRYSSGSTSDLPKVVRTTNKRAAVAYNSWNKVRNSPRDDGPQEILTIPGPVGNAAGLHTVLTGINFGAAFVESTSPVFSSDELLLMVSECGLNRLNIFPPIFCQHIIETQKRLAMNDDALYKALLNMRSIIYGAMPMPADVEKWAFEKKLPVVASNLLGATEAGPLLYSHLRKNPQHLRPFPGLELQFIPQHGEFSTEDMIYKLAVLPTSPNIPEVSLRDPDGKFYTGDLFSRNDNGTWSHRGRYGDWIKIQHGKLVDTKAVEDFVRVHCSDIVAELVVVGNTRPSLVILAEPVDITCGQSAKDRIVERMASFNARRYAYERISIDQIVFVKKGTLPRTAAKGYIRRKGAEAAFREEIDAVFALMKANGHPA